MRSRLLVLIGAVAVLVIVMVVAWRMLPYGQRFDRTSAPVLVTNAPPPRMASVAEDGLTQRACESAGGLWTDCGSPCRGAPPDTYCIEVCVPQCVCGGERRWECPKEYSCTDYLPAPGVKNAMGVCRKNVEQRTENSATTTLRAVPPGTVCGEGNFICVDESFLNATLQSPFTVTGTAAAFEQTFSWRLEDANGEKIEEGFIMTSAPDVGIPGPFTIRAFILTVPRSATGTLVLFEASPKDGTPTHVLRISVKLPKLATTVRSICETQDTSVQVAKTSLPVEASLRRMLRDVWHQELTSVRLSGGTLTVVIPSDQQDALRNTCIERTAKQFAAVKNVVVTDRP